MIHERAIFQSHDLSILKYNPSEHPLALQIGGKTPETMKYCARIAEEIGYDEVNLNVGCPSVPAQKGGFGAFLFQYPELVAECVDAMSSNVHIPITVKTRIGVDNYDTYKKLHTFVGLMKDAGAQTIILHARKALLKGLNPKQNRSIPPLQYEWVSRIKKDFPECNIIANGGIKTIEDIYEQCSICDGVMIGREIVRNPYLVTKINSVFFGGEALCRSAVLKSFIPYIESEISAGESPSKLLQPLCSLCLGMDGAKKWRLFISGLKKDSFIHDNAINELYHWVDILQNRENNIENQTYHISKTQKNPFEPIKINN